MSRRFRSRPGLFSKYYRDDPDRQNKIERSDDGQNARPLPIELSPARFRQIVSNFLIGVIRLPRTLIVEGESCCGFLRPCRDIGRIGWVILAEVNEACGKGGDSDSG